jgi:hypothetical protein
MKNRAALERDRFQLLARRADQTSQAERGPSRNNYNNLVRMLHFTHGFFQRTLKCSSQFCTSCMDEVLVDAGQLFAALVKDPITYSFSC